HHAVSPQSNPALAKISSQLFRLRSADSINPPLWKKHLASVLCRPLTLANDRYRPRLLSRPHIENDIDAVALRIDDIIFGMPTGRDLSLMDGSDGVDRIE